MKIGIVLATVPANSPRGGVEQATHSLSLGLARAGHTVTVLSFDTHGAETWPGVSMAGIGHFGRGMLVGGAGAWRRSVTSLLAEIDPDVVQGQGIGFAGYGAIGWKKGPRVVAAHGNVLKDMRFLYSSLGWAVRSPLARAYCTASVRGADVVVNVTPDWRVNCPVAPLVDVHIPNPIDEVFFSVKAVPEPGRVAFFGGRQPIKGLDLLLKAWPLVVHRVPAAQLDIYGTNDVGRLSPSSECCARGNLLDPAEVAAAMSRASAVVVPSRFEVSPLTVAQAMAVGVPLVATDVGGVRAMAEGVAHLCRPEPRNIADALVSALSESEAGKTMIVEGRSRSEAFRVERVVASYASLYEALVRGRWPSQRTE